LVYAEKRPFDFNIDSADIVHLSAIAGRCTMWGRREKRWRIMKQVERKSEQKSGYLKEK